MAERFASVATPEDEARWVASFVDDARKARQTYEAIWQVTLQNYLVRPWNEYVSGQLVQYPFLTPSASNMTSTSGYAILKDPESHQIVESLLADEMTLLFGDGDFCRVRPVGLGNANNAEIVQALEHYVFRLPGHYRSFYEWLKDGKIFGLSILFGSWHYKEEQRALRSVARMGGIEVAGETYADVPVYDDYRLRCIDIFDFFWDPGATIIQDMLGAARRFTVTEAQARLAVKQRGWDADAVEEAIANHDANDSKERTDKGWREGLDRSQKTKHHEKFKPMTGYCYYGEVPYNPVDGSVRRRVEVLSGQTVKSSPFYGALPFFQYSPCPIQGRFPGIAPLEVIRYTQDFADAMLMLNADAAARMVHPPHIVNRYADVDYGKLKRFRPDTPILANDVSAVKQVEYAPPIGVTGQFYASLKQQMREGSGALGAIQGANDGPDRESATGYSGRYKQARGRPEAQCALIEREWLPPIAVQILEAYQRFATTDDLTKRVGHLMGMEVNLANILPDFDIEFVGSRIEGTKPQRIQAYQTLFAQGANPYGAPLIPWAEAYARFFKDLGLYEEASKVAQNILLHTAIAQAQPGNQMAGNGNGTQPALPPQGLPPAQMTGGPNG